MEGVWRILIRGSIPAQTVLATKSRLYSRLSDRDLNPVPFMTKAQVLPTRVEGGVGCELRRIC